MNLIMNRAEDLFNKIRNSQIERLLFCPFYLRIVSIVETALLVISIVGWPLLGFALLPLSIDLTEDKTALSLYQKWRKLILVLTFILFFCRTPYLPFVTSYVQTYRNEEGCLESYFRPLLRLNKSIIWIWALLLVQAWIYMLTINASLKPVSTCYNEDEEAVSESDEAN